MNHLVNLVTSNFPYATEILCLFMAIQGSMAVRNGPNSKKTMNWFHAFFKSTHWKTENIRIAYSICPGTYIRW